MPDTPAADQTVLEVISPDSSRHYVQVNASPFLIGRGGDTGITCSSLTAASPAIAPPSFIGRSPLSRRLGQRWGIFVNGEQIENRALGDGDVITSVWRIRTNSSLWAGGDTSSRPSTRIGLRTGQEPGSGAWQTQSFSSRRHCFCTRTSLWMPCSARCSTTHRPHPADRGSWWSRIPPDRLLVRLGRRTGNVDWRRKASRPARQPCAKLCSSSPA